MRPHHIGQTGQLEEAVPVAIAPVLPGRHRTPKRPADRRGNAGLLAADAPLRDEDGPTRPLMKELQGLHLIRRKMILPARIHVQADHVVHGKQIEAPPVYGLHLVETVEGIGAGNTLANGKDFRPVLPDGRNLKGKVFLHIMPQELINQITIDTSGIGRHVGFNLREIPEPGPVPPVIIVDAAIEFDPGEVGKLPAAGRRIDGPGKFRPRQFIVKADRKQIRPAALFEPLLDIPVVGVPELFTEHIGE